MGCPYHYGLNANHSDCFYCVAKGQEATASRRHQQLMGAMGDQTGAIREQTRHIDAGRREAAAAAARQEALLAEANMYASITAQATETIAAITAEEADRTQRFHFSQYIQTPHGEAFVDWQKRAVALAERIQSMTLEWTNAWIGSALAAAGPLDPYLNQQPPPVQDVTAASARGGAGTRSRQNHPLSLYVLAAGGTGFVGGPFLVALAPDERYRLGPGGQMVRDGSILDPLGPLGWTVFVLGLLLLGLGTMMLLGRLGAKGARAAYTAAQSVDFDKATGAVRTLHAVGAGRTYARQAYLIDAYNGVLRDRLGPGLVHVAPTSVVEGAGVNAWIPGALGYVQELTADVKPLTSMAVGKVSEHLAARRAAAAEAGLPPAAAGMLRVWDDPRYEMVVAKSWSSWNLSDYLFTLAAFAEQARTHYPSPDQLPELRYPPAVDLGALGSDPAWIPGDAERILADARQLHEMGPLNAPTG